VGHGCRGGVDAPGGTQLLRSSVQMPGDIAAILMLTALGLGVAMRPPGARWRCGVNISGGNNRTIISLHPQRKLVQILCSHENAEHPAVGLE